MYADILDFLMDRLDYSMNDEQKLISYNPCSQNKRKQS